MWTETRQAEKQARYPRPIVQRAGRSRCPPAENIVGLQRLAGNRAVSSLVHKYLTAQRCGDHPCNCVESEVGEAVQRTAGSLVVARQRGPTTTAVRRGTTASASRLDVRLSTNGRPCACVVFIHNNERNARLTAELMHDHCAYNLAIISPDAASRRITLPGHRSTVDPNELFTPDIADQCVRDEQACRDFVTNNAGARDNRTVDRVVRTQFFLAIQDCSAGFSLPVVALHNNARDDTAAYSRQLANQRRTGRDSADLRMDVDKTGATDGNQTVAQMLRRLRTRFGANVQRGLTERAGSTNIFRWCASNDLSRCHIGDPDRPDNHGSVMFTQGDQHDVV